MKITASKPFDRDLRRLALPKQERVRKAIEQLASNPASPGLHVEKVRGGRDDVRSCRVSRGLRLIFRVADDGVLELLHVGDHDRAYRKAAAYWLMFPFEELGPPGPEEEPFMTFEPRPLLPPDLRERLFDRLRRAGISEDAIGALFSIVQESLAEGTDGRARTQGAGLASGLLNVIPSEVEGPCHELLLAQCFDGDSFGGRLREVAYHAGIHCPDTQAVVIVTSKWDPREWKRNHERAFVDLRADVVILLAAFGTLTQIA